MPKNIPKGEKSRATAADVSLADPKATVPLTSEHPRELTCPADGQPTNAVEEKIRARAHSKWEASGCPPGDGIEFWLEAEREVKAEVLG